ncbi:phosphoserine phosphatase SerB [Ferrimonas gelatinilytica]|uniref:Phosphoserine phosphatase n=1 Tax=Ferrimonas gelatinilytica TaxID=1255257 RepID=A0ABP9RUF0_9GAMM
MAVSPSSPLSPWDPTQETLLLLRQGSAALPSSEIATMTQGLTPVVQDVVGLLTRQGWQGPEVAAIPALSLASGEGWAWVRVPASTPSLSQPGLLLMDMDSTAIAIECIDEIARRGGVYDQVAEVTERAMQGGLDFEASLRQRVAMLKGIPADVMDEIAAELPLNPGLTTLCQQLKRHGWVLALASGGFNRIAAVLARQLGLNHFEANDLAELDGCLSGQVEGPIVDARRKAAILAELGQQHGIPATQWLAVGDGANDLPMLGRAALGVGYRAKPAVAAQVDVHLATLGLDAIPALLRP